MSYPIQLPKTEPVLTITHPTPISWVIELHYGTDNRLAERVLREGLTPALDIVERDWRESTAKARKAGDKQAGHGSLVIVGKRDQEKFFSNGFPYEDIVKKSWYIHTFFNPIIARLLTYPIPTVCAMNGHTFAAGFLIAMACDYRVMSAGRAWASMNEIHFGAPMPRAFAALFRAKSPSPAVTRKIFLEGHRFVPQEMLALGLVDEVVEGGTEKVLEAALALGAKWAPNAKTNVWGLQKREIYLETLKAVHEKPHQMMPAEEADLFVDSLRARL
ncbi:ClpP/crotonase [Exidia glandulosa HHB12029]|uniref:ClpP/crotonase n=1 Tax=Exidia glandulosa HHB12029 TaxID=1314781 RepID=A0A165DIY6_EXIGL|nr:ClpP/crotonase [Exidia glandulosa HHB12029]